MRVRSLFTPGRRWWQLGILVFDIVQVVAERRRRRKEQRG